MSEIRERRDGWLTVEPSIQVGVYNHEVQRAYQWYLMRSRKRSVKSVWWVWMGWMYHRCRWPRPEIRRCLWREISVSSGQSKKTIHNQRFEMRVWGCGWWWWWWGRWLRGMRWEGGLVNTRQSVTRSMVDREKSQSADLSRSSQTSLNMWLELLKIKDTINSWLTSDLSMRFDGIHYWETNEELQPSRSKSIFIKKNKYQLQTHHLNSFTVQCLLHLHQVLVRVQFLDIWNQFHSSYLNESSSNHLHHSQIIIKKKNTHSEPTLAWIKDYQFKSRNWVDTYLGFWCLLVVY